MFNPFMLARRNIIKNPWQSLFVIVGISLTVSFVIGNSIVFSAISSEIITTSRRNSNVDISIYSQGGEWFNYSELAGKLASKAYIARISPVFILYSPSLSLDDVFPDPLPGKDTLLIYGIDPESHPDWDNFEVYRGNKTIGGTNIIISDVIATEYSLGAGSEYQLGNLTFTISGIFDPFEYPFFGMQSTVGMVIMEIHALRALVGVSQDTITSVTVTVADFREVEQVHARLTREFGADYLIVLGNSLSAEDKLLLTTFQTIFVVIVFISNVVEFFFLFNFFLVFINDHQFSIGLMRTLGLDKRQVAAIYLLMFLFFGFVGAVIGLLVGYVLIASLIRFILESRGLTLSYAFQPTFLEVFLALETGVGISVVAAAYPIVLILRYQISEALQERRSMLTQYSRVNAVKFFVILGLVFFSISVALTLQAALEKRYTVFLDTTTAIAILLAFFGFFSFQFILFGVIPSLIEVVFRPVSKVVVPFVIRNIKRYQSRSIITIASNAIAFAFAVTILILTASLTVSVPVWYNEIYPSVDLIVETNNDFTANEFYTLLQKDVNVSASEILSVKVVTGAVNLPVANETAQSFSFLGINASEFSPYAPKILKGRSYADLANVSLLANGSTLIATQTAASFPLIPVIVTNNIAKAYGLQVDDTLPLSVIANTTTNFTAQIIGISRNNIFSLYNSESLIFISDAVLEALTQTVFPISYVLIKLNGTRSAESVQRYLYKYYPLYVREIYSVSEELAYLEVSLQRQDAFLTALTYHVMLMAILTQLVALMLSAELTRYEVGLIRLQGLTRRQVFLFFVVDSAIIGIFGVLFGLMDGYLASLLVKVYIETNVVFDFIVVLPVNEIILWTVLFLGSLIAVSAYPGWKSASLELIRLIDKRAILFSFHKPIFDVKTRILFSIEQLKGRFTRRYWGYLGSLAIIYIIVSFFATSFMQLAVSIVGLTLCVFLVHLHDIKRFSKDKYVMNVWNTIRSRGIEQDEDQRTNINVNACEYSKWFSRKEQFRLVKVIGAFFVYGLYLAGLFQVSSTLFGDVLRDFIRSQLYWGVVFWLVVVIFALMAFSFLFVQPVSNTLFDLQLVLLHRYKVFQDLLHAKRRNCSYLFNSIYTEKWFIKLMSLSVIVMFFRLLLQIPIILLLNLFPSPIFTLFYEMARHALDLIFATIFATQINQFLLGTILELDLEKMSAKKPSRPVIKSDKKPKFDLQQFLVVTEMGKTRASPSMHPRTKVS